MPGFVHEPLSRLSLGSSAFKQGNGIRFSDDLRTQRGTEILCLPFTLTPFRIVDLLRSLPQQQASPHKSLRLYPSSLKESMLAAFPILVPIYLAQYQVYTASKADAITFTAILEAHDKRVRTSLSTFP